jgi:NAD(P)-dependent dehydrogenase (short-subunit alcohol dehydrogenase family)
MSNAESKIALVTGAGTGIGRAVALALLCEGYSVTLVGRRQQPLQETADMSETGPEHTLVFSTDVSNPEQVEHAFAETRKKFGRLDLLFNNAGLGSRPVPMEELEIDEWKQVVDVNLTGAFLCTQEAIRIMKSQQPTGGRIINNGSISAHTPRPFSAPYTATKHAITGLTKSTSLDGRVHDIVCGQIDIGNAATPMTERMAEGVPQANGSLAVEPTMNVDNVGRAVVYMDSLPLKENVLFMTVMANEMPFVGRG